MARWQRRPAHYSPNFALRLLEGASDIAPHTCLAKLKTEDFSRGPAWVAELTADSLTHDEVQPVQAVAAFACAGERFEREFPRITLPVLMIHSTADNLTGNQLKDRRESCPWKRPQPES